MASFKLKKVSNYTLERINELYNQDHNLPLDYQGNKAKDVLGWAEEQGFYVKVGLDPKQDTVLRDKVLELSHRVGSCPHCINFGIILAAELLMEGFHLEKLKKDAEGLDFEEFDGDEL